MLTLCLRNLALYCKDKTTVLLSFLAEFIIVGLYVLFIRDQLLESFSQLPDAGLLMDVWMIAGVLGIAAVTTTMGACGVMVEDKARKIDRDFRVSPLRPGTLLGSYWSAAVVIGLVLSFLLLLLAEVYVSHRYGVRLGAGHMAAVYGILLLVSVSGASQVLLLVSFLKTGSALAGCCTILGSLIGFLTGIYLPMGTLPEGVRYLVTCFPISHGVVLLRRTLLEPLLSGSLGPQGGAGAPSFEEYMGVLFTWRGETLSCRASVVVLLSAGAVCLVLTAFRFARPRRQ